MSAEAMNVESAPKVESNEVEMKDAVPNSDSVEKNELESESKVEEKEEDVTGDGGVMKKILKKGDGWRRPENGAEVKVHYVGKLLDGTVFDSSRERNAPFEFSLGKGQVIKGWEKGIAEMKKGEIALLTIRSDYAYGKDGMPPKIPADATLQFEVELLEWVEEKDVSEAKDGGIMKKILKEGEGWKNPKDDSKAKVTYKGFREDGSVFDEKTDFEFTVGAEEVIEGLDIGIKSMKKGETAKLLIKSSYGYGKDGKSELNIKPDEKLTYDVELLDFTEEKESWNMSTEEKFEVAEKKRDEGNKLYQGGKYKRAFKKYKTSLDFFEYESSLKDEEKSRAQKIKIPCLLNSAACKLKMKEYNEAKEFCNKVLKIEPANLKALYRRGIAHMELVMWYDAEKDFTRALEIDPNNKDVKKELQELRRRQAEQDKKDRKVFGGIFQKMAKEDEAREKKKKASLSENEQKKENEKPLENHQQPQETPMETK